LDFRLLQHYQQSSADINYALGLQGDDPTALFLLGGASHFMARHRVSVSLLERATELNPNLAMAYGLLGISYASIDRPADGLAHVEKAMRLSPRDDLFVLCSSGALQVCLGGFFGSHPLC
jgi:tetratricopeptide (TPR) repeat protein